MAWEDPTSCASWRTTGSQVKYCRRSSRISSTFLTMLRIESGENGLLM